MDLSITRAEIFGYDPVKALGLFFGKPFKAFANVFKKPAFPVRQLTLYQKIDVATGLTAVVVSHCVMHGVIHIPGFLRLSSKYWGGGD